MNSTRAVVWRWLVRALAVLAILAIVIGFVAWYKLFREVPQQLATDTPEEYFKYGSIGTEAKEGVPYYVWQVLPRVFPEYLPRDPAGNRKPGGYAALGVAWEPGRATPVGFSVKTIGFPRIGINCAFCHTATYRTRPDEVPHVVPTGPAVSCDPQAYVKFLGDCASDPRFNGRNLLYQIEYDIKLDWLDKLLYRYVIIPRTKQALIEQKQRYSWMYKHDRPRWGPGRIDPFNPVKFHQLQLEWDDTIGNSDMMPLWDMAARQGHLHWDGLNTDLTEVVLTGAIGDGATNETLPVARLAELEAYLKQKQPPPYPFLGQLDSQLAERGRALFQQHCAECHAPQGERTRTVIPLDEIGTDSHRARMWTAEAAETYSRYADGYPWDFKEFVDIDGYVAVPLQGLWLRAPYLHNGSVPTLEALLESPSARPRRFYRGSDVVQSDEVGFRHDLEDEVARRNGVLFDTTQPGNSNQGHAGPAFGTTLAPDEKRALIEYLKTL